MIIYIDQAFYIIKNILINGFYKHEFMKNNYRYKMEIYRIVKMGLISKCEAQFDQRISNSYLIQWSNIWKPRNTGIFKLDLVKRDNHLNQKKY